MINHESDAKGHRNQSIYSLSVPITIMRIREHQSQIQHVRTIFAADVI